MDGVFCKCAITCQMGSIVSKFAKGEANCGIESEVTQALAVRAVLVDQALSEMMEVFCMT